MKRCDPHNRRRMLAWTGALAILLARVVLPLQADAHICGLNLELFTAQADPHYTLGVDPVEVMLVIANETGFDLNTTRGFSQEEFHKGVILTTPSGERRQFVDADLTFDMPPPFFINDLVGVPAETLAADWARTVTIMDLRELFPVMATTPGWYTIEVQHPFVRYLWTVEYGSAGLLGVDNQNDTCREMLTSNRIQVYIAPPSGAQMQVRVMDGSSQPPRPLGQVPVKVFDGAVADQDFNRAWTERQPVLEGTTDFEGLAAWGSGGYCRPEPDSQYTGIAQYGGVYRAVPFASGPEWGAGCGSVIARQILFGTAALPGVPAFSLLAVNSVWIKAGATIESGHIGVMDTSPGLWLDSGVEISVGLNAHVNDGVQIYGDSIKLWPNASVDEIAYNELHNEGEIRGAETTPLELPLAMDLPELPLITPGENDYYVPFLRVRTIEPGQYRNVSIGYRGTLKLSAGVYHVKNLDLGYRSQLFCLGPTEIRIKNRLYPGYKAKIGPLPTTNLGANDLIIYVEGSNGNLLDLFAYPRAAEIGPQNRVKANIVAPNGTIAIDAGSDAQGSFIGQGVVVGIQTDVRLESGF